MFSVPQLYRSFGQYSFYCKWMKFSNLLSKAEKVVELGDSPDAPPFVVEDIYQVQLGSTANFFGQYIGTKSSFLVLFFVLISPGIVHGFQVGQSKATQTTTLFT